jgi:hypothetical protein
MSAFVYIVAKPCAPVSKKSVCLYSVVPRVSKATDLPRDHARSVVTWGYIDVEGVSTDQCGRFC